MVRTANTHINLPTPPSRSARKGRAARGKVAQHAGHGGRRAEPKSGVAHVSTGTAVAPAGSSPPPWSRAGARSRAGRSSSRAKVALSGAEALRRAHHAHACEDALDGNGGGREAQVPERNRCEERPRRELAAPPRSWALREKAPAALAPRSRFLSPPVAPPPAAASAASNASSATSSTTRRPSRRVVALSSSKVEIEELELGR